ncbi:MAG: hypothetical protein HYT70_01635 [Candidatus Aenigmarchaeota archaeon]|nr:hypothetical protein [Candidatus Aenigmarchaeota archaeon]
MVDSAWKTYLENTEVIVHAGGLSERWYPVTQGKIPKVLTRVGKKPRPMLDWTILPYVKAGFKKIFISLWHDPEKIMNYCRIISENTGIEFVFLIEWEKRLGRAGVLKHYLEKSVLDSNKNKINVGGADIVNINLDAFAKFHLQGMEKGFLATLFGSTVGMSQFDKIIADSKTNHIVKMDIDRTIVLPGGEFANMGTVFFDSKLNQTFLKIKDERLPMDWENMGQELFGKAQCYGIGKLFENWYPLKTPYDYKKVKDIDLEKWFGVDSVEKYLGPNSV